MSSFILQEATLHGDSLIAQEVGKQTRNGLTGDTPKTEDFFSKAVGLLPFASTYMLS